MYFILREKGSHVRLKKTNKQGKKKKNTFLPFLRKNLIFG